VWSARNEQGFLHRQHGDTDHMLLDYEGLVLVTRLRRKRRAAKNDQPPETDTIDSPEMEETSESPPKEDLARESSSEETPW
jgi:hypothetical protein